MPLMSSNGIDASSYLSLAEGVRKPIHADNYVSLELPACGRSIYFSICLFFSQVSLRGLKELMGLGLHVIKVLRSNTDAPQSAGLLWTRYRAVAENSFSQHNPHMRQASKTPAGFKPTIPAIERPQNGTLDRAAKGIGTTKCEGKICNRPLFLMVFVSY